MIKLIKKIIVIIPIVLIMATWFIRITLMFALWMLMLGYRLDDVDCIINQNYISQCLDRTVEDLVSFAEE